MQKELSRELNMNEVKEKLKEYLANQFKLTFD
jgi:hypothetical protein